MVNHYLVLQLCLASILASITPEIHADCEKNLSVGWERWPPYQYVSKHRKLIGLDVELVNAIADEAGYELHFYELPWQRHLLELERGKIDVALGASYDTKRALYAHFSAPVRKERVSVVIPADKTKFHQLKDLSELADTDFRLGATLGYHYGEKFAELMEDENFSEHVEQLHTDQLNFMKLLVNRLDGILVDPISVSHQLAILQEDRKLKTLFDVYNTDVHLMFSKKSVPQVTVGKFNDAIKQIKKNGTYQKIMDRYLEH